MCLQQVTDMSGQICLSCAPQFLMGTNLNISSWPQKLDCVDSGHSWQADLSHSSTYVFQMDRKHCRTQRLRMYSLWAGAFFPESEVCMMHGENFLLWIWRDAIRWEASWWLIAVTLSSQWLESFLFSFNIIKLLEAEPEAVGICHPTIIDVALGFIRHHSTVTTNTVRLHLCYKFYEGIVSGCLDPRSALRLHLIFTNCSWRPHYHPFSICVMTLSPSSPQLAAPSPIPFQLVSSPTLQKNQLTE